MGSYWFRSRRVLINFQLDWYYNLNTCFLSFSSVRYKLCLLYTSRGEQAKIRRVLHRPLHKGNQGLLIPLQREVAQFIISCGFIDVYKRQMLVCVLTLSALSVCFAEDSDNSGEVTAQQSYVNEAITVTRDVYKRQLYHLFCLNV